MGDSSVYHRRRLFQQESSELGDYHIAPGLEVDATWSRSILPHLDSTVNTIQDKNLTVSLCGHRDAYAVHQYISSSPNLKALRNYGLRHRFRPCYSIGKQTETASLRYYIHNQSNVCSHRSTILDAMIICLSKFFEQAPAFRFHSTMNMVQYRLVSNESFVTIIFFPSIHASCLGL